MNLTKEFLDNVKNHKMKILLDNGVYRHLCFRAPETVNRYFEIVTYPGYLVISGDMGTYVFRRLTDMFEFFRHDEVNLDYWSEKIDAEDKHSKVREFSPEKAEEIIRDHINEYFKDGEDEVEKKRVLEEFEDLNFEDENDLYRGLNDIASDVFQDHWEWSFKEYNFHFVWCCQAIVWAIKQWDSRETK